jgi:MFS family permease
MAAFLAVEARVKNPIMPLRILRLRGLVGGSVILALLYTGKYSTFFLGTIYLEHVLHYSAVAAGAAFLPWTLTVAALSLGITARLIKRFGAMRVLVAGMTAVIGGLVLLAGTTPETAFMPRLFVAFFLIGLGIGSSFMPLMTVAMADVPAADAGLGSGLTTLSQQVGGALGLAVLGTIATSHTHALLAEHTGATAALVGGDHLAYLVGAFCVFAAIGLSLVLLRTPRPAAAPAVEIEAAEAAPGVDPHRSERLSGRFTRVRGARGFQPARANGERAPLRAQDSQE